MTRCNTITADKYFFILYLRDTGLTWIEIAKELNYLKIKTTTKKKWKEDSVRKFTSRRAGTNKTMGFDPIEYGRISRELVEVHEQILIERMILSIKRRATFD
jgi:hypothetical protein|tara:strand:+ start:4415 stop:4720 length:306 start_codon:yes stop_codon:yes gene_type:complete